MKYCKKGGELVLFAESQQKETEMLNLHFITAVKRSKH